MRDLSWIIAVLVGVAVCSKIAHLVSAKEPWNPTPPSQWASGYPQQVIYGVDSSGNTTLSGNPAGNREFYTARTLYLPDEVPSSYLVKISDETRTPLIVSHGNSRFLMNDEEIFECDGKLWHKKPKPSKGLKKVATLQHLMKEYGSKEIAMNGKKWAFVLADGTYQDMTEEEAALMGGGPKAEEEKAEEEPVVIEPTPAEHADNEGHVHVNPTGPAHSKK